MINEETKQNKKKVGRIAAGNLERLLAPLRWSNRKPFDQSGNGSTRFGSIADQWAICSKGRVLSELMKSWGILRLKYL